MSEEEVSTPFHYIKSSGCRNLPVQGVFGGVNPVTGQFHMATFVERPAIPQEVLAAQDGTEKARHGKVGVVREIDAILHFDVNMAVALSQWLKARIDEFKSAHPDVKFPEGL